MTWTNANDAIDAGLSSHEAGQLEEAAAAYQQALLLEPQNPDALNLLGVVFHQRGDFVAAIEHISRAIEVDASAADFYANLGEARRASGNVDAAVHAYSKCLELDKDNSSVWANLASLLQRTRRFQEASICWQHAARLEPTSPEFHNNLGVARSNLGQIELAADSFKEAIRLRRDFVPAKENLVEAFLKARRYDEAIEVACELTVGRSGTPAALVFLAATCIDAGRYHDALEACRDALKVDPDWAEAHFNLGLALNRLGEPAGAALAYARVTELRPDAGSGHMNLGLAALSNGHLDQAAESLTRAAEVSPEAPEPWFNLAVVNERLGDVPHAIEFAEKARILRPAWPAVSSLIGTLHLRLGHHTEAEAEFRRALRNDPDFVPALAGLANMHIDRGEHLIAIELMRQAVRIDPSDPNAYSVLLMAMTSAPRIAPDALLEEHRAFGRAMAAAVTSARTPHANDPDPERRIRVGYVSPDLRAHSVAFFLLGLFRCHDHGNVEIVAYDDSNSPDKMTEVLRSFCHSWNRVVGMSNERLADLIREHEIDILVDLAGHTTNNRLASFAHKPAPVQVSYLGYPNTSGLEAIDYRFTDLLADPTGMTDRYHSEKLVRLPGSFLAYTPAPNAPPVQPLPALSAGHVMFASFNNSTKLHDELFTLWARVLRAVPGSKLTLKANGMDDPVLRERVIKTFTANDIDPARLVMLAKTRTFVDHMNVYGTCDIALDSFPYNGTTTTCEAMWMGVPVVGLAGDMHAGRVGVSLLTSVGLADWIASSTDEYVEIASRMAADLPRLATLRGELRARMAASPLMDAPGLARNVEAAYRSIWKTWCDAHPASDLPAGGVDHSRTGEAGTMSVLIEGWRFLSHSYSVVNSYQCALLAGRPGLKVFHRDAPLYNPAWQPTQGLLPEAVEQAIRSLPSPGPQQKVDVAYRIAYPINLRPVIGARKTFVFVTSEFIGQLTAIKLPDGVDLITPSDWSKRGLLSAGVPAERVHVVPHGVDPAELRRLDPAIRDATRKRHRLDGFVYLNVGAMTDNKGIVDLLLAFAAVSRTDDRALLLLKGSDSLYASRELLGRALAKLDSKDVARVEQRTRYIGSAMPTAELAALYNAADCYVTPYRGEAFNMPALEAVACGLPLICSDGGPTDAFGGPSIARRINTELVNGSFDGVPAKNLSPDLTDLTRLMRSVVSDSVWQNSARRDGPRFVTENFSWQAVVERLQQVCGLIVPRPIAERL